MAMYRRITHTQYCGRNNREICGAERDKRGKER
jgi:hypothetical protein